MMTLPWLFAKTPSLSPKRNNQDFTVTPTGQQPSSSFWREVFSARWVRILIAFVAFLVFLLLWNQINYQFTVVIFTVLPVFVGYGLSYLLDPVSRFFQQFFSRKTSQIFVFIFFLIFTLGLVLGLFFLSLFSLTDCTKSFSTKLVI